MTNCVEFGGTGVVLGLELAFAEVALSLLPVLVLALSPVFVLMVVLGVVFSVLLVRNQTRTPPAPRPSSKSTAATPRIRGSLLDFFAG